MPHISDIDLTAQDIAEFSSADALAGFLTRLGYPTDCRQALAPSALGLTGETAEDIRAMELLAEDDEQFLRVLLVKLRSITAKARTDLVRNLAKRAADHVLILTSDFEILEFVLIDKKIRQRPGPGGVAGVQYVPRLVSVDRRTNTQQDRRILRRLTWTGKDGLDQFDKLRSVFEAAHYTSHYFQNRALFADHYLETRLREDAAWQENPADCFQQARRILADARHRWAGQPEQMVRDALYAPVWQLLDFKAHVNKPAESDHLQPDYLLHGPDGQPATAAFVYRWDRWLDGPDLNDPDTPDENPGAAVVTALNRGDARWIIVTNGKLWRLYSRDARSRSTNFYEVDLEEALRDSGETDPNEAFRYWWLFFRAEAFLDKPDADPPTCWLDEVVRGSRDYAKRLSERLKDRIFVTIFPHLARGFLADRRQRLGLKTRPTDDELSEIYEATLTLLYRILFLLYAEARDLLPLVETPYREVSLKKIKEDVAERAGVAEGQVPDRLAKAFNETEAALYDRLADLFRIMDKGDTLRNVPQYNGGLFITCPNDSDHREHRIARFLKEHKVPDRYLALAIDRLARDQDEKTCGLVFIDYKSLEVRHLGSIYEGLLEFKLKVADEDLATRTEKRKEKYIPLSQAKAGRGRVRTAPTAAVRKGDVYLSNDKAERKATGSYYTPDPIVEYIVEHTVGPVLDEKLDALRNDLNAAGKTYHRHLANARSNPGLLSDGVDIRAFAADKTYAEHKNLVEKLFDIKVLDPAMGSGHFLVEAVDFITDRVLDFLNRFPNNPVNTALERTRASIQEALTQQSVTIDLNKLTDVNLLKRHVLKRCIYGVDLNPMAVELAKVSLWLDAFTLGAPLSFLDHHLRCGNSLIGANFKDLEEATRGRLFSIDYEPLLRAIRHVLFVNEMADATAAEVHQSARKYAQARRELSGYKIVFDLLVADHFLAAGDGRRGTKKRKGASGPRPSQLLTDAHELDLSTSEAFLASLRDDADRQLVARVESLAGQPDRRFFHWELEFPEVFFDFVTADRRQIKHKNDITEGAAGFDAVVGNPPYDEVSTIVGYDETLRDYFDAPTVFGIFKNGRTNLYRLFVLRAISLLHRNSGHGFIVPLGLFSDMFSLKVRTYLLERTSINRIEAFPQKDDTTRRVFPDAKLPTVVYTLQAGGRADTCHLAVHPGKHLYEVTDRVAFKTSRIAELFPTTMTIPLINESEYEILEKRFNSTIGPALTDVAGIFAGEICDNALNRHFLSDHNVGPLVLRGAHIDRYRLRTRSKQGADRFLDKDRFLRERSAGERTYHHQQDRVVFQKGAALDNWRRMIATIVPSGYFCFDTIGYLIPKAVIDLNLLLALMNSSLWEWRFRCVSQTNHVNAYEIGPFRIPSDLARGGRLAKQLSTLAHDALLADHGVWRTDAHTPGINDAIDQEIDRLVFDAYELTDSDRTIVTQKASLRPQVLEE